MPAGVRVETGTESADRASEEIRDNLSFLQTFLLVFGFIAVFVGSFLIFNTFSITVAQRVSGVRDAADDRRLASPDPHHGPVPKRWRSG